MIAGIQIYEALHLLFANDLRLADKTHYADKTRYSLKPTTGRIYPFAVRENEDNTVPYVIYQTISNQPENTLDGPTGHEWVRMQIDVYHNDLYKCILLANKVINRISEKIPQSVYGGKTEMYEDGLYRVLIEYEFWQTADTE